MGRATGETRIMRNIRGRRWLVVLALIPLVAGVALAGWRMSNDFVCSGSEKRAISEFSHYEGAQPVWESNFKITGGCTGTYSATAAPETLRDYYVELLAQHGWTVEEGPDNSSPLYLEARRDGLRYFLHFFDTDMDETVRPGKTSVGIMGGHDG